MGVSIVKHELIDMNNHGKTTNCQVHLIHVKVNDIKAIAEELINTTLDISWITPLELGFQIAYEARAQPTIEKLVDGIFKHITNQVTSEFGEYLISYTAQTSLKDELRHEILPIAELWKEKSKGNPGFDFHTETSENHIAFGEAKYDSNTTPHTNAITQIANFITLNKDSMELSDLKNFVSHKAYDNAVNGKKAYVAAFSMTSAKGNFDNILKHPFSLSELDDLILHQELFIIGVEICQ